MTALHHPFKGHATPHSAGLKAIIAPALAVLALGGCASNTKGSWSCPAQRGAACASVAEIDSSDGRDTSSAKTRASSHETLSAVIDGAMRARSVSEVGFRPGQVLDGPVREPDVYARIAIAPWVDAAGDYHNQSEVVALIRRGTWRVPDVRPTAERRVDLAAMTTISSPAPAAPPPVVPDPPAPTPVITSFITPATVMAPVANPAPTPKAAPKPIKRPAHRKAPAQNCKCSADGIRPDIPRGPTPAPPAKPAPAKPGAPAPPHLTINAPAGPAKAPATNPAAAPQTKPAPAAAPTTPAKPAGSRPPSARPAGEGKP